VDIRRAVSQFVMHGNELFNRLRSDESVMLTATDIHMLRVQLYILDAEARRLERKQSQSKSVDPPRD
jgi:hypothetical protein